MRDGGIERQRAVAFAVLVAWLGAGCTRTLELQRPRSADEAAAINEAVGDRPAHVVLQGERKPGDPGPLLRGAVLESDEVQVAPGLTRWSQDGQPVQVPTQAVEQISVRYHGRGALEGGAIGALSGALAGAACGAFIDQFRTGNDTRSAVLPAALGGAAMGLFIGGLAGLLVGHTETLDFTGGQTLLGK